MPVSTVENTKAHCAECGHDFSRTEWTCIDLAERPDLLAALAKGGVPEQRCPRCLSNVPRARSLLVLRLNPVAPLLLGLRDEYLEHEIPPDEAKRILDAAQVALGPAASEIPGPYLRVPFDVLEVAARRNVESDLAGPEAAVAAVDDRDAVLGHKYGVFLRDVAASLTERRIVQALNMLLEGGTAETLADLFMRYPELDSDQAREILTKRLEEVDAPDTAHAIRTQMGMIDALARNDPAGAATIFAESLTEMWQAHLGPRFDGLMAEIEQGEEAHDWDVVITAGEELLRYPHDGREEAMEFEAMVSFRLASAYYNATNRARSESVDRVIELLERVLQIQDTYSELDHPDHRAQVLNNLGSALGARLRGDPRANQDRAITCYEQALALTSPDSGGRLWPMAHTNLGLSLLERVAELRVADFVVENEEPTPEMRDAAAVIEEAIAHFLEALRWRSYDEEPLDWAFTQINLGLAYGRRRGADRRSDVELAIAHHSEAVRGFRAAGEPVLLGQALHNLASEKLVLALLDDTSPEDRGTLLEEAAVDARASLEVRPSSLAPIEAGRTWSELGRILGAANDLDGAAYAYRIALETLTPDTAPRACREAAGRLADLAISLDDWDTAAEAWNIAATAAAAAAAARATVADRFHELEANLNIFRFAAYALVRAGQPERAVEVLELGRAQELRRWLHRDLLDLEALQTLDPQVAKRFAELQVELADVERAGQRSADWSIASARIAEEYRETAERIRRLPNFKRFLLPPAFADVSAAVPHHDAVAYVLSAPDGCAALIVSRNDETATTDTVVVPDVTSRDLFEVFLDVDVEQETVQGYFLAHHEGSDQLDTALGHFAAALGPSLLRPVAEILQKRGARRVCLIPISLLGLLPLHALGWDEGGEPRCLLDYVEVVFAPSAFAYGVCVRRAAERRDTPARYLIVGNPLPHPDPLEGAEFEARTVAATAGIDCVLLVGEQATKRAVIDALPGSTHVHLACHGEASIFDDALNAALSFASDERLTAREIIEIDGLQPRLVVASACESGVIQGYATADEALSIGTLFIGAGAAGAIASLWVVDDFATALLMSRFYELLEAHETPPSALRAAQLWLRDLTDAEEDEYLATRPALKVRRDARRRRTNGLEGRRYGAINDWAAFVYTGA
jgi:CHAT domain-containing protein